jgi:phosphoglucomutase
MNKEILEKAKIWTQPPFDETTRKEVADMMKNNPDLLVESFYKDLEFGTGGMRGIMGSGTNRINKYTLGKNTQGLANYINKVSNNTEKSVAVNYDVRHNSKEFARLVAGVLSANGIRVYLFSEFRPTPELSFAVRYLKTDAGIVLTASHNPPEYNGYKVYWNDGAQIVPPQDQEIINEIEKVKFEEIKFEADENLITYVGKDLDDAFLQAAVEHGTFDAPDRSNIRILFTSLHGTSIKLMPPAMKLAGFSDFHIVEEQMNPDPEFSTVKSPNPEEPEAFTIALKKADEINAEMILATDPDSDRIAVAVREPDGYMRLLNGNQTMAMMDAFLIRKWHEAGKIKGREFIGSTIVSTDMIHKIGKAGNVAVKVGLTGFKWIAKMIREAEGKQNFIGGGEESFGYMVGDFVRDKDAITAGLLAAEIASEAKSKGSSFFEELLKLYQKHGFYKESLVSLVKKGVEGQEIIKKMMFDFRNNPPQSFDNSPVVRIEDYQISVAKNLQKGTEEKISVEKSNVLIFYTADGSKIAMRPSGTEPKIKFYFSVNMPLDDVKNYKLIEQKLDEKIARIKNDLNLL